MNLPALARTLTALTALAWTSLVSADVVVTKSGARLLGTVTAIDGTHVVLSTDYAGDISIKQNEVESIETTQPLTVRLAAGTTMAGTISSPAPGQIAIAGADGTIPPTVTQVARTWAPGQPDPAIQEGRRKWSYQVGLDITGKNGNSEQLGTAVSGRAVLKGPQDALQFYTAYNRQKADGVTSSDQFRAGIDYANNFSGRMSWYVRNEGGFDRVKGIELYNVSAVGFGYDLIKAPKQTLTSRGGISFRYEGYENPATPNVRSTGLDLGLNHSYTFGNSRMVNSLSFVPAFDDFGDFRALHETAFEMPLAAALWTLRIGVNNDYNSRPGDGIKKMDTTYFSRLVFSWE